MMIVFHRFIHQWSWLLLISFCVGGLFSPFIGLAAVICMIAPIATAFFKGRKWCGYFCPRGSFLDVILVKLNFKREIPALFKKTWFKIISLTALMSAFIIQLLWAWGNMAAIGYVFIRMIIVTTLIAVVLGMVFKPRTWCLICPMGVLAQFVAKLDPINMNSNRVTFHQMKCINCKLCNQKCPLSIDILSFKNKGGVFSAECLKCEVCVAACPKKSLYVA